MGDFYESILHPNGMSNELLFKIYRKYEDKIGRYKLFIDDVGYKVKNIYDAGFPWIEYFDFQESNFVKHYDSTISDFSKQEYFLGDFILNDYTCYITEKSIHVESLKISADSIHAKEDVTIIGHGGRYGLQEIGRKSRPDSNYTLHYGRNQINKVSDEFILLLGLNTPWKEKRKRNIFTGEYSVGSRGDSGSPILNDKQEVIGLASLAGGMKNEKNRLERGATYYAPFSSKSGQEFLRKCIQRGASFNLK